MKIAFLFLITIVLATCDQSPDQWYNHINPLYHNASEDVYVNNADKTKWILDADWGDGRIHLQSLSFEGNGIDVDPKIFKLTFHKEKMK